MIVADHKVGAISKPWAFAYVLLVALFLAYAVWIVVERFLSGPHLRPVFDLLMLIAVVGCGRYIRLALALAGALLGRNTTVVALKGDTIEMLSSPLFRRRRTDVNVVKLTRGRRLFSSVFTLEIIFEGGARWFVPGFLVLGDVASLSDDVLELTRPAGAGRSA